jgi:enoyl-CoA hydratase
MANQITNVNFEPIVVHEEAEVIIAVISRPEAMNALNRNVLDSLDRLLTWLEKSSARCLILTGSGEKAFVAGADIKQFEAMSSKVALEFSLHGQKIFSRIEELKIPVIAAVNGFALGGGLELALACDFIYASDTAKFALPESTLGLMPGFGGTVRLPRRVGAARAKEMAFSGAMITAQDALNYGLINKIVPQAELLPACLEAAKAMTVRAAPLSISMIKKSIKDGLNLNEREAEGLEAKLFAELFSSKDKDEGVKAFIEKRKPSFQGN